MKKLRTCLICLAAAVIVCSVTQDTEKKTFSWCGVVNAQDDWRNEFDDVCSRTQDAMIFSPDELRNLIARCDKLKPLIEKLDETQRKVFLKRLQLCRDLFLFVLESKEKK
jgi:hypothetical protein